MVVFECPYCEKEVKEVEKTKIKGKMSGVTNNG
jgi:hypothetical protein